MKDNKTPHRASEYDGKIQKVLPYYTRFHAETIDLVKTVNPGVQTWLDTGCGTGYLVENALKSFRDCTFYLADPSESMLEQARKRLEHADSTKTIFLEAAPSSALAGQIGDKPEVITSIQSHHYLSKTARKEAITACYDLLEENGLYITFENIKPLTEQGITYGLKRWMRFQREQGRSEKDVAYNRSRFGTEYFPLTVTEHLEVLKECGFKAVEVLWYSQMQAGFYGLK